MLEKENNKFTEKEIIKLNLSQYFLFHFRYQIVGVKEIICDWNPVILRPAFNMPT